MVNGLFGCKKGRNVS